MTTLSNCPVNLVASLSSTLEMMKKEALEKELLEARGEEGKKVFICYFIYYYLFYFFFF